MEKRYKRLLNENDLTVREQEMVLLQFQDVELLNLLLENFVNYNKVHKELSTLK